MTARQVLIGAINPALALLPERMNTPEAVCMLLAICGQESNFQHRWQVVDPHNPKRKGPARGLWQFERGGGVRGVLTHTASRSYASSIAEQRIGATSAEAVWRALEHDDVLAAAFARLLLWTDPARLPVLGDVEGAWRLYLRCWRPGAYTRGTADQRAALRAKWGGYYAQALREVAP